jgi:hypothetical protein
LPVPIFQASFKSSSLNERRLVALPSLILGEQVNKTVNIQRKSRATTNSASNLEPASLVFNSGDLLPRLIAFPALRLGEQG